jgi:hypothetical protein
MSASGGRSGASTATHLKARVPPAREGDSRSESRVVPISPLVGWSCTYSDAVFPATLTAAVRLVTVNGGR